MKAKISIRKEENMSISVLHILKGLNAYGSELDSLSKIAEVMEQYRNEESIEILFNENEVDIIKEMCEEIELKYKITRL